MSNKRLSVRRNQQGIASLLFTMVMMVVISLIVLSFAQIARSGQRQALDTQLSTQAFYAAESGVNDIQKALPGALQIHSAAEINNTGCRLGTPITDQLGGDQHDLGGGVSYTCARVNVTPDNLAASLTTASSTVLNLQPVNPFTQFTVTWKPTNVTKPLGNCPSKSTTTSTGDFSPYGAWSCPYAVVRIDLVPVSGYALSRSTMSQKDMAIFAVPTRDGDTASSTKAYGGGAYSIPAVCTTGANAQCSITISSAGGYAQYKMRALSKYLNIDQAGFVVTAQAVAGADLQLANGQAVVDVTGRAQDVLRRIQVRLPLTATNPGGYSDYGLASQDSVCKRFTVSAAIGAQDANSSCPSQP